MVKIIENNPETRTLSRLYVGRSDERLESMVGIARKMFKDVTHEWAASHPQNVQSKYDLQMEAHHPSGRAPELGVGFALWAVKPYNSGKIAEELTRVINVYTNQNKISVNDPKYFDDAMKLAQSY